jgi:putative DNA primase/helicase
MVEDRRTAKVIPIKANTRPAAKPATGPDINLAEAGRFLEYLGDTHSFQTFDDNKSRKDGRLTRVLHGTLEEHADALCELNQRGAGIFVTLNQTDGKGRAHGNITAVRAVMWDSDGAPLKPVVDPGLPVRPHLIVETSPDRYQAHWIVDSGTGIPLGEFKDIQYRLAKAFDGDTAVAMLTVCARIPGFFHRKSTPFRSRLVSAQGHANHGWDEICREWPGQSEPHKLPGSAVILPAGQPLNCAEEFAKARYWQHNMLCLHFYKKEYYEWAGTHYRLIEAQAVEAELYAYLKRAWVKTDEGLRPFNPNNNKIDNIMRALRASVHLDLGRHKRPPFWLPNAEGERPTDLIAFRNGLLDLKTATLMPHSPSYFNMNAVPFDYDPEAPEPQRWYAFLWELWPNDDTEGKLTRRLLREVFGYLLSGETRQQKLFLVVGPKRSGKGTIRAVLEGLLGEENVAHPSMEMLGRNRFGASTLLNKQLAVIADARLRADVEPTVELLLNISGEDPVAVDRKNNSIISARLGVRFLILTNELPRFRDASGALAGRFVPLIIKESIYNREQLDLKEELAGELTGILNWALKGYRGLCRRGQFLLPALSQEAMVQLEDLAAPVTAFVRASCTLEPEARMVKGDLYEAYQKWCATQGIKVPVTQPVFGKELLAAYPKLTTSKSGGTHYYRGIRLQDDEDIG